MFVKEEMVIVLDFGGQYNQLIARRVRECNVYCEVLPYTTSLEKIKALNPKGIIFTGGPNSVYDETSPHYQKEIFEIGVPILGICYGAQLIAYTLGGIVKTAPVSEYGHTEVEVDTTNVLFDGVSPTTVTWMSHTDYIAEAPAGFAITGHTPVCPVAAMSNDTDKIYAVQFHPEVMHSVEGMKVLSNFVYKVCGCAGTWKMDSFVETTIKSLREKIGTGKFLLCHWDGTAETEQAIKDATKATIRCIPVDSFVCEEEGKDIFSGKPSKQRVVFAISY